MSVNFRSGALPPATAPSYPLAAQESGNIALPYPGLPAEFVLMEDTWNCLCPGTGKKINFKSATNTSLMQYFFVIGNPDGSIGMTVEFGVEYSKVELENYLISNDLTLNFNRKCIAVSKKEVSDLFRIVFTHNTIPANMLDRVRTIATECRCACFYVYEVGDIGASVRAIKNAQPRDAFKPFT